MKKETKTAPKMAEMRRTRGAEAAVKKPITAELFTTGLFMEETVKKGAAAYGPATGKETGKTTGERADFASVMTTILRGGEP